MTEKKPTTTDRKDLEAIAAGSDPSLKIPEGLKNDKAWMGDEKNPGVGKWLAYMLSDEGQTAPNNPFADHLKAAKEKALAAEMDKHADELGYKKLPGQTGYVKDNGKEYVPVTGEDHKKIHIQAQASANDRVIAYKKNLMETIAAGYGGADPVPVGDTVLKEGIGGAVTTALSGDISGIGDGFLGGVIGAVKNLIFSIPIVGKLLNQVSNWVGGQFAALTGQADKPMSWEEAGKRAEGSRAGEKAVEYVKGITGLPTEQLQRGIENVVAIGGTLPDYAPPQPPVTVPPTEAAKDDPDAKKDAAASTSLAGENSLTMGPPVEVGGSPEGGFKPARVPLGNGVSGFALRQGDTGIV